MTAPSIVRTFNEAATPTPERKAPPPVSVRLNWGEYERLRHDAGAMSMAAYIRLSLFGEGKIAPSRKSYTHKKTAPSSELAMIGQILGRLGESGLASSLADMAQAARIGAFPVSTETEEEIRLACEALGDIRVRLISALGVKSR